ncbi:hypothetical protein [Paraliomyxa miuraensis]|uniref:hypothetical protein n=1 Tax=Paraliomyxa miuraensis TaxID=376150 RepID=UPI00224FB84B|nr:hypothetical protein [Paraliomyxa miuraensis]MCX4243544.1 hypothetical protein [Paraliomyxa miuraensis]
MWLAAAILWGLGSPGEPPGVELQWETVPGCPEQVVVEQELLELLDASPSRDVVQVRGRLTGERGAHRLRLEVVVADRREARTLVAGDCMALSRAGVLVVAVTVDALTTAWRVENAAEPREAQPVVPPPSVPDLEPRPPPERTALEPRPTVATEGAEPSAADRVEGSTLPRWPRGGTLSAGGGASIGLTPGLAGGLEGALTWRIGAARLSAAGFHWFSRTTELQPEAGVEAALFGGSLRGCLAFERARWEAPLCTSVELAAMHGGGTGTAVRRREVLALWVGGSVGLGLDLALSARFGLWARVDAVLSMRRPAMFLVVEGQPREAFRISPVGARLFIGPCVRLW